MKVTIHQPEYLPWLGFFHKIAQADIYVALDTVQYRHRYFQNRNRIRSHDGYVWLNVPVLRKGKRKQCIKEVRINNAKTRWREKTWRSICLNYEKAHFFKEYAPYFQKVYRTKWNRLVDINLDLIHHCLQFLGLSTRIIRASELGIHGHGPELIFNICQLLSANVYISGISGIAGKGTANEFQFRQHNIQVVYDEFHHPIYSQLYEPFIPCLSIIDVLFNYGQKSLAVINGIDVSVMKDVFL